MNQQSFWSAELRRRSDDLHERAQAFARGASADPNFDALAVDIARYQFDAIAGYRRLVKATTGRLDCLDDIPAVPVEAFRMTRVAAHPQALDTATFLTSGTTSGARGGHHFRRTDTYRNVALIWGRKALLEPTNRGTKVLCLAQAPSDPCESSLAFMMQAFVEEFDGMVAAGRNEGLWLLSDGGVDVVGLRRALEQASAESRSVLILATSFALVYLLDELGGERLNAEGRTVVMQTGGFKGKSRQVEADELRGSVAAAFGIPSAQVISEYGMTELSSQLYEGTLPSGPLQAESGWLLPPPWLQVKAVDPSTQLPTADGTEGIACFTDLANVDSAVRILTMDRVICQGGKVKLLGRYPGALPRGCSLAIEEMMM